jgi:Tfp pilus assembly PilM family ATPase
MAKQYIAGISVDGLKAHLAVFRIKKDEVRLLHLEEYTKTGDDQLWFLEPVLKPAIRPLKKVTKVSVALDDSSVVTHLFPMDTTLTQSEQNEYAHWELSNIIPGYQSKEYLYDLHILKIRAREQVAEVLVIAVKRSTIFALQEALGKRKLELHIADMSFFGAEQTFTQQYPENKLKTSVLIYVTTDRLDIGFEANGRLANFSFSMDTSPASVAETVKRITDNTSLHCVYCCGPDISEKFLKGLQEALSVKVDTLNPFRMNIKTSTFKRFQEMSNAKYLYAAATGVALRKQ